MLKNTCKITIYGLKYYRCNEKVKKGEKDGR